MGCLAEGPISVEETLAIAKQIAEALEAGHEAGVIHRDVKPANVKLKEEGTVNVLDYGLAKALEGETATGTDSQLSQSPTLTRHGTRVVVILGTAAYMSPEQAEGEKVGRADRHLAFGAVLFERLAAKKAFPGEGISDVLASVIKSEPGSEALPSSTADGSKMTYTSNGDIFERPIDREEEPVRLLTRDEYLVPESWSSDGRLLALTEMTLQNTRVWVMLRDGAAGTSARVVF